MGKGQPRRLSDEEKLTMTPAQMIDRLYEAQAETKDVIREAHETVQTVKTVGKEARELIATIRAFIGEDIDERIKTEVSDRLGIVATEITAVQHSLYRAVLDKFAEIELMCFQGGDPEAPNVLDLARKIIERSENTAPPKATATYPEQECPYCRATSGEVHNPDGSLCERTPNEGDIGVCFACGGLLKMRDGVLCAMTTTELAGVPLTVRQEIADTMERVRARDRR